VRQCSGGYVTALAAGYYKEIRDEMRHRKDPIGYPEGYRPGYQCAKLRAGLRSIYSSRREHPHQRSLLAEQEAFEGGGRSR